MAYTINSRKEIQMKKKIIITSVICFMSLCFYRISFADCRGCCNGHQGIICDNGITKCVDGTELSQKCKNKGCEACDYSPPDSLTPATIKIASFNLYIFGQSKLKKQFEMAIIAYTISQFDIVAIQEIRDKKETAIPVLENMVDALGTDYTYITSVRLGRSSSKEQYAYMFKTDVIEQIGSGHVYPDNDDTFEREPYSAHFKVKSGNFDFVLLNIHTKPKNATEEIEAMPDTIQDASNHFAEPDVIALGDYNADCRKGTQYYDENNMSCPMRATEFTWIIPNEADTNLASGTDCTYDRIILTTEGIENYAQTWGVYRFDLIHNLDYSNAKKVSDHYPVWAEFYVNVDHD